MRLRDDNGFTLIEIIISTAVITIASLAMASLAVWVTRGNLISKQITIAVTLAQDRLEQVKRIGYGNINDLIGTEDYGNITNYSGYKRVTKIDDDEPILSIKTIIITVSWNNDEDDFKIKTILGE